MTNMTLADGALRPDAADLTVNFIALNGVRGAARHSDTLHEEASGIHDDTIAQRYGYRGALVPGILICGHTMPALVDIWGEVWLERGRIFMKHIRPAFDGEMLTACFRWSRDGSGDLAEIVVYRDAVAVAVGNASLPDGPVSVPEDLPRDILPIPAKRPLAEPGILKPGQRLFTRPVEIDTAEHGLALSRLGGVSEEWPYGSIHPYVYQHITSHDAIHSFVYSTPGIHVAGDTQMLGWAEPGLTLQSSGHVVAVYERKGHHYFDTEQLVQTVDGKPIAICRRTVIYKAREAKVNQ